MKTNEMFYTNVSEANRRIKELTNVVHQLNAEVATVSEERLLCLRALRQLIKEQIPHNQLSSLLTHPNSIIREAAKSAVKQPEG